MERPKLIVFVLLLLLCKLSLASFRLDVYNAYISNNMEKWKAVVDEMESKKINTNETILELINYQYGYVAWCIGNKKYDLARQYVERGEKNIEILELRKYNLSMVNAYKSAFMGFYIGLRKVTAPYYGPKSIRYAQVSIKLDDKNPFGYIQYANSHYYMPEAFGGSKTIALNNFLKAQKLMEHNKEYAINNWNYLSLLTIIAQTYSDLGYYNAAKNYYEKILHLEPNYTWVKNELYPLLLKKIE